MQHTMDGSSTHSTSSSDVLVIGAGITGLTLGYRLRQHSVNVVVVEASPQAGGAISTRVDQGFRWEEGPNSFTPSPALLNLIADVGLADQLIWADGRLPRYVYWDGELLPVPLNPAAAITSSLLTVGGKLRALRGVLGFVSYPPGSDESVQAFFSRQLGSQVTERLVIPFVSGVYAGDANQLSAMAAFNRLAGLESRYGSLFAGLTATITTPRSNRPPTPPVSPEIHPQPKSGQLGNLREGLSHLTDTLTGKLGSALKLEWSAQSLQPVPQGYRVQCQTPTGSTTLTAPIVILTTPAYQSARVLDPLVPLAAAVLRQIPYPPVAVIALGYPQSALPDPLQGFGHLIPRSQGLRTLGTIWASSLFPNRAPEGYHCFLNFLGGATDPAYAQSRGLPTIPDLSASQRAEWVHRELSQILLKRSVEPIILGERLWTKAIPQYTIGHLDRLAQLQTALAPHPGLSVCGNYLDGVSVGDCVKRAEAKVLEVLAQLQDATPPVY